MSGLSASTSTTATNPITQPDRGGSDRRVLRSMTARISMPRADRDDQDVAEARRAFVGGLELDRPVEQPQVEDEPGQTDRDSECSP